MIQKKWTLGATALAFALGTTGTLMLHSTDAFAAKGGKIGKVGGKGGHKKERDLPPLSAATLAGALGKPLTADQTKAVEDAQKTYVESVAKAVGLTPDELKAKVREYRKAHKGRKGGAPTAPTVAPPATTP